MALALMLAFYGCKTDNQVPFIGSIDGPKAVSANDSADYACQAWDAEGKPMTYRWSSSHGAFDPDTGKTVRWFTPDSSDSATIYVTVTDAGGGATTDSLRLAILADTVGLVFWDATVKQGLYHSWQDTIRAGHTMFGKCWPDSGRGATYLAILDSVNFALWLAHQNPDYLFRQLAYECDTFSLEISQTGVYHIMMDNTRGLADYDYWLSVWEHSK